MPALALALALNRSLAPRPAPLRRARACQAGGADRTLRGGSGGGDTQPAPLHQMGCVLLRADALCVVVAEGRRDARCVLRADQEGASLARNGQHCIGTITPLRYSVCPWIVTVIQGSHGQY